MRASVGTKELLKELRRVGMRGAEWVDVMCPSDEMAKVEVRVTGGSPLSLRRGATTITKIVKGKWLVSVYGVTFFTADSAREVADGVREVYSRVLRGHEEALERCKQAGY